MRGISALEIKVGVLIIAGIVATLALVLISDRLHFERFYKISAYLADAGGLRNASPVTLSGIRIGEVERLMTSADNRGAIRVEMKINERFVVPAEATLAIGSSGIFGDSYLAFTARGKLSGQSLSTDGTAEVVAGRGFIENASQQAERILAGASDLLAPEMRVEIKRLLTNAADLAGSGALLAKHLDDQSRQLGEALAAMKNLADSLHTNSGIMAVKIDEGMTAYIKLAASIQSQVDVLGPKLTTSIQGFDALAQRGEGLLAKNTDSLTAALGGISEMTARVNRISAALESGQGVIGKLIMDKRLASDVDSIAIDFTRLASLVADHPESLVFGLSGDEKAKEKLKRSREKQRRVLISPLREPSLMDSKSTTQSPGQEK